MDDLPPVIGAPFELVFLPLDLPLFLEQVADTPDHYEAILIVLLPPLLNQYVRTYSDMPESHILTKSILALPRT